MRIISLLFSFLSLTARIDCWNFEPKDSIESKDLPLTSSKVSCNTTKGRIVLELYREWSPLGYDRFVKLVQDGFYTDIALFRCVEGFLTQFGISVDVSKKHWHEEMITDDPNLHIGVRKYYISFAGGGPNTRTTQVFIAFDDLPYLGYEPWETPFGKVIEGHEVLDALHKGYGDIHPFGSGPDQQMIHMEGNEYIRREFPNTDFIEKCMLLPNDEDAHASVQHNVEL